MTPPTLNMSPQVDLVDAYEALREAVVSCGTSAATPVDGRHLLTEGLFSWGRYYSALRAPTPALNRGQAEASQELQLRSAQPQAAVVSLMATMALHAIDTLEALS